MPHDSKGNELKPGDEVLIRARVQSIEASSEYCNATVHTLIPMPPYTSPFTIVLNTKQVEKVDPQPVAEQGHAAAEAGH